MSPRSNVEALAEAFTAFSAGDRDKLGELLIADSEFIVPDSIPYGGTFRGREAIVQWLTVELRRWFEEFDSTPEGFIGDGDQIVVPVRVRARARNGQAVDVHHVWIYEFRAGKLLRGRVYADTAVLRDAMAGMEPAPV